jgi:TP901 family phage tail tape measure protein
MALERMGLGAFVTMDNRQAVRAMGQTRDAYGRFIKTTDSASMKTNKLSRSMTKLVSKAKMAGRQMKVAGQQFSRALTSATMAGAPLAVGMGIGFAKAANFERQMSAVGAITRATDDELDALRGTAKKMGIESVFSATQSAEAMEFMARAGASTTEIIAGLSGVMNAAAADSIDLATAADIVAQVVKSMGLAWGEASHVADVLALTSASTNTNIIGLGEAFRYGAPQAKAMGLELEETAALMGKMADAGLKGSIGGTSFMNMLNKLTKPSGKAKKLIKAFGLEMTDTSGRMRPISAIVNDVSTKLDQIPDAAKRAAISSELFGLRGAKAFNALRLSGKKAIDALHEDLLLSSEGIGAAGEMAEKRLDNFLGKLVLFKSSVESSFIGLFEPLLGPFADTTEEMTNGLNRVLCALDLLSQRRKRGKGEMGASSKALAGWTAQQMKFLGVNEGVLRQEKRRILSMSARLMKGEQVSKEELSRLKMITAEALAADKKLSQADANRAADAIFIEAELEAARLKEADAIRTQIFQLEALNEIEEKHGRTARMIAEGVQAATDQIRESWERIVEGVKRVGEQLRRRLGDQGVKRLAKYATIFAMVAAAAVPLGLAIIGVGFAVSSLISLASSLGSVLSAAFWPVVAVVGVVALTLLLFKKENESLLDTAKRVWKGISSFVLDFWRNVLKPFFMGIKSFAGPAIEAIGEVFSKTFSIIGETIQMIAEDFGSAGDSIQINWKTVGQFLVAMLVTAIEITGWVIRAFLRMGQAVSWVISKLIVRPLGAAWRVLKGVFAGFMDIMSGNVVQGLKRIGTAVLDSLLMPLQLALRGILDLVRAIPGADKLIPKSLITLAEKGVTGLAFGGAEVIPEKKKPRVITPEEDRASRAYEATEKKLRLEEIGDLRTRQAELTQEPPKTEVNVKIPDQKLESKVSVIMDGEEVARASAKHKFDVIRRNGGKAANWSPARGALEEGVLLVGG